MKMFLNHLREKILPEGDVYVVNLDQTIGDEIQKKRQVLILNGGHEKNLKLTIVVPITRWQIQWKDNPFLCCLSLMSRIAWKKGQWLTVFKSCLSASRDF